MNFKVFATCVCLLATSLFFIPGISADNTLTEDQDTWLKTIHLAWAEEDDEFKNSATSPLAGVSRFEISETGIVYFAVENGQIGWNTEKHDQAVFSLVNIEGGWTWAGLAEDVSLIRKEDSLPTGSLLAAGDNLQIERFTVQFYPSRNVVTALVFDPDTQRIKEFKGLNRFEANPKFALTAKIKKFESPEQLDLITGLQRFKKQYRYAKLQFEIDGTGYELTAYKHALEGAGSSSLFIPFTDKTSGKYTYGGGRYLIVDEPAEGDEILIDFNLVINPLCSYADIYNCIVPTRENKLNIAVLAGVMKYDFPGH